MTARSLHGPAPPAPHRVGRLRFELDGGDEGTLLRLRGGIVAGAETWIPAALDRALAAVDEPGRTRRLERLEIDLGTLPPVGVTPELLTAAVRAGLARALRPGPGAGPQPRVTSDAGSIAEALRFFLEHGRLPWWSPRAPLAALEAEVRTMTGAALRMLAAVAAPALRQPRAARRLVQQLEPDVAVRMAAALPGARAGGLTAATFRAASGEVAVTDLAELVRAAAAASPRAGRRRGGAASRERAGRGGAEAPDAAATAEAEDAALGPPPPESAVEEAIAVADAGLVLLHPFLAELFGARGLTARGRLVDSPAQRRAVHLTAFLATGEPAAREPDLVMAKLLCGWPLDEPLAPMILPNDDVTEAEALLRAVIAHWSALGSASPVALRETFLLRPGRLSEAGDGWRLEVEPRGADVLLGRLPWVVSPVRLPWMPRPLFVDWA